MHKTILINLVVSISCAVCLPTSLAKDETRFDEQFSGQELDWKTWCPCQVKGGEDGVDIVPEQRGNFVATIGVRKEHAGGNFCRSWCPDLECLPPADRQCPKIIDAGQEFDTATEKSEPLGPSLVSAAPAAALRPAAGTDYCEDEDVKRRVRDAREENICIQRQELRLQKKRRHDFGQLRSYSFLFRILGKIEDTTNSIRWVTAQWKHDKTSPAYNEEFGPQWGPSPFLAQRFDNGVLHVTVQDEHCRCKVASAKDPNDGDLHWTRGRAAYCVSTRPCERCSASCLADLYVEYGDDPWLPNPSDGWVEMRYNVQGGPSEDSDPFIEVYADGKKIVRVTGSIGYHVAEGKTSKVKFKIGHYRDYMPFEHLMKIDWLRVD